MNHIRPPVVQDLRPRIGSTSRRVAKPLATAFCPAPDIGMNHIQSRGVHDLRPGHWVDFAPSVDAARDFTVSCPWRSPAGISAR
jgi:hypothetical protein